MRTLDLSREQVSVEALLKRAATETVRIVAADDSSYILEEDFDKEVELLGKSEKFSNFPRERSQEPTTTSIEEFRRSLE